jgi:hypothetical protein
MGRRTNVPYLRVLDSTGAAVADTDTADANWTEARGGSRGVKKLTAAQTYYVPIIGSEDGWLLSLMAQWDATILITSITIEETSAPEVMVPWHAASAGNWFATDAANIVSAFNGAGTTTNTTDIIAHTAAGAGGSIQDIQNAAAGRYRAVVVVGATGGEARFHGSAKE